MRMILRGFRSKMMATRSTSVRIREAGLAGHAPALIINYSGRFGSRLGNEVIFLPGRRQRRRRRHRRRRRRRLCLSLHTAPGCYLVVRKVVTHVTTWPSREIRYAKQDTPIRPLCTLSRPISAPRTRIEPVRTHRETGETLSFVQDGSLGEAPLLDRERSAWKSKEREGKSLGFVLFVKNCGAYISQKSLLGDCI